MQHTEDLEQQRQDLVELITVETNKLSILKKKKEKEAEAESAALLAVKKKKEEEEEHRRSNLFEAERMETEKRILAESRASKRLVATLDDVGANFAPIANVLKNVQG